MDGLEEGRVERNEREGKEEQNKKRYASIIEIGRGEVPHMKPRPEPMISILNASPRIARTRGRCEGGTKV